MENTPNKKEVEKVIEKLKSFIPESCDNLNFEDDENVHEAHKILLRGILKLENKIK